MAVQDITYRSGYTVLTPKNNSTGSASFVIPKPALLASKEATGTHSTAPSLANFQSMSGATWTVSGSQNLGNVQQTMVTPPTIYTAGGSQKSATEILNSLLPKGQTSGVGWKTDQNGKVILIPSGATDSGVAAYAAGLAGIRQEYAELFDAQREILQGANIAGLNASDSSSAGSAASPFDWQKVAVIGIAAIAGVALLGKVLK